MENYHLDDSNYVSNPDNAAPAVSTLISDNLNSYQLYSSVPASVSGRICIVELIYNVGGGYTLSTDGIASFKIGTIRLSVKLTFPPG